MICQSATIAIAYGSAAYPGKKVVVAEAGNCAISVFVKLEPACAARPGKLCQQDWARRRRDLRWKSMRPLYVAIYLHCLKECYPMCTSVDEDGRGTHWSTGQPQVSITNLLPPDSFHQLRGRLNCRHWLEHKQKTEGALSPPSPSFSFISSPLVV
jgi:hypothetical protein